MHWNTNRLPSIGFHILLSNVDVFDPKIFNYLGHPIYESFCYILWLHLCLISFLSIGLWIVTKLNVDNGKKNVWQTIDLSKDFSDEILELKLRLENERQLRLQAEAELQAKCSGLSNGNSGSAEVKIIIVPWLGGSLENTQRWFFNHIFLVTVKSSRFKEVCWNVYGLWQG